MRLSIIIPVMNVEERVKTIYRKFSSLFEDLKHEIIFVDDASTDNTYKNLKSIYEENRHNVKIIRLSKRCGKSASIECGINHASGDFIAIYKFKADRTRSILEMFNFLNNNLVYDSVTINEKNSSIMMFRKNIKTALLKAFEYEKFSDNIISSLGFEVYSLDKKSQTKKNKFNIKLPEINYLYLLFMASLSLFILFVYMSFRNNHLMEIELLFALLFSFTTANTIYLKKILEETGNNKIRYVERNILSYDDDLL